MDVRRWLRDMDARRWNRRLDARLAATGVVDRELFGHFRDAYAYDAASTVQALEAKLGVLARHLRDGGALTLFDPRSGAMIDVRTHEDLLSWIGLHFPGCAPGGRAAGT